MKLLAVLFSQLYVRKVGLENREKLDSNSRRYSPVSFDRREEKSPKVVVFGGPLRSSPANIRFAAGELVEFLQTRARVEIIEVESRANKLLASGIAESEATVSRVTDCPRRLPARSARRLR